MNEHVREDRIMTMTTKEATEHGVKCFAGTETALAAAIAAIMALREAYTAAYVNGDLSGTDAITEGDECFGIAGKIAEIKALVIAKHVRAAGFAKAAGTDINEPYAELPPRTGEPMSGGR